MTPVQTILQFIGTKELSPLADYIRKEILPLEEKMLGEAWDNGAKAMKELLAVSLQKHKVVEGLDDRIQGILKILAEHIPSFPIPDKETYINSIINPQK